MSKNEKNPIEEMLATADQNRAAAAAIAGVRSELVEQGVGADIADQILLEMFRMQTANIQKAAAELNLKAAELNIGKPF